MSDNEEVINLVDNENYQILASLFESSKNGTNIADILEKISKDLHILAKSVSQLIQLSLASHKMKEDDE